MQIKSSLTWALLIAGTAFSMVCASCKEKDMTLKLNNPRNIRGVVSYRRSFGDLNEKHLNIAQAIGIRPLANRAEAEHMTERLTNIVSCDRYAVDSLTHSIPFLVPGAAALVDSIGVNFLDSCQSEGTNPNKVVVTSVLRTVDDVKRLRRRNGNAPLNSAHFYGTTFDVSWKRFCKVEDPEAPSPAGRERRHTEAGAERSAARPQAGWPLLCKV